MARHPDNIGAKLISGDPRQQQVDAAHGMLGDASNDMAHVAP